MDDTLAVEEDEAIEEEADAEVDKVLFDLTNGKLGLAGPAPVAPVSYRGHVYWYMTLNPRAANGGGETRRRGNRARHRGAALAGAARPRLAADEHPANGRRVGGGAGVCGRGAARPALRSRLPARGE